MPRNRFGRFFSDAAQGVLIIALTACGGGSKSTPVGSPSGAPGAVLRVVTIAPTSHATGVAADATVSATFNAPIDPGTLNASTFLLMDSNNGPVMGTVTYDATSKTAVFQPATPLQFDTRYSAHVTSEILNASGAAVVEREWSFAVQSPPVETMLRTGPVNGATGISIKGYAYGVFPGIVDPASVTASSFLLTDPLGGQVPGVAKLRGLHTVVFYPAAELNVSTQYTAKLAAGIRTTDAGSTLTSDLTWAFTTAATRTATIQIGDGEFDDLNGLATDADGNVFATGTLETLNPATHEVNAELLLTKLAPDGRVIWQTTFTAANAQPSGVTIKIDNNKDAIVLTQRHGDPLNDDGSLILKASGATGTEIWRKTYGSPGDDQAMDLALGTTGEIYVAAARPLPMHPCKGKPRSAAMTRW